MEALVRDSDEAEAQGEAAAVGHDGAWHQERGACRGRAGHLLHTMTAVEAAGDGSRRTMAYLISR